MERSWPARDMAPLIALIADPAPRVVGGRQLSACPKSQARAILDLQPRPPNRSRTRRDRGGFEQARRSRSSRLSRYPAFLAGSRASASSADELAAVKRRPRQAAAYARSSTVGRRYGRRGPHPARGHGRAPSATRVTSSACRCRPTGRNGGAARAARAWQTRDEDFVARLFVASTHTACAVLLVHGPGLQGEGLAAAARRPAGARQGARQHVAARARRAHHHGHASA